MKPFKNKCIVVLKAGKFDSGRIYLKKDSESDNIDENVVEQLKTRTESNDDLFIIADMSTLILNPKIEEVDKYI